MSKNKTRLILYALGLILVAGTVAILVDGWAWQILSLAVSVIVFGVSWALLLLRKIHRYWYGSVLALVWAPPLMLIVSLLNLGVIANLWLMGGLMIGWAVWMALFMRVGEPRLRWRLYRETA